MVSRGDALLENFSQLRFRTQLKALRYFFCVAVPPVAVLMTGRILSFILSLLLTLLGWIPGVIHACLVVNDYQAEHRR
jgi:uncharacterized membrane protein YqaE (UPF0057 family)